MNGFPKGQEEGRPDPWSVRPAKDETDLIEWGKQFRKPGQRSQALKEAIRLAIKYEKGELVPVTSVVKQEAPVAQPAPSVSSPAAITPDALGHILVELMPSLAHVLAPTLAPALAGALVPHLRQFLAAGGSAAPGDHSQLADIRDAFQDARMYDDDDD